MPLKDLSGVKKGVLLVLHPSMPVYMGTKKYVTWECLCDCGRNRIMTAHAFRQNNHVQCNCDRTFSGDKNDHPLYAVWSNMMSRCYSEKNESFINYGGRGISVDPKWWNYLNFYNDNIDRFILGFHMDRTENDGNYELSNTQWITQAENNRKSRRAKLNWENADDIRNSNEPRSLLAEKYGVSISAIHHIHNGVTWVK